MKARESEVEVAICIHAQRTGWITYKFVSPGHRGVPDRIFLKHPHLVFMEIKRPGEIPTPLQMHEIARLTKNGWDVAWVDTVEKGIAVLDARK